MQRCPYTACFTVLDYECMEGKWTYTETAHHKMFVTNPDGTKSPVKQEIVTNSEKTSGIHDSPVGGNADHLSYIKDKARVWIHWMQNEHLLGHIAWTTYKHQLKVWFWDHDQGSRAGRWVPSRRRLQITQRAKGTPKCHKKVAAAPYNLWRFWPLQSPHRTIDQLSEHANATLSCLNKSREKTQRIAQISSTPIRHPSQSLYTGLWQVGTSSTIILGKNTLVFAATLWYTPPYGIFHNTLPRERDQVIMEIFHAEGLGPDMIRGLGRCGGALKSKFLSNITTADGRYLENFVFNPDGAPTESTFKFPWESTTKDNWNLWFNFWHQFTSTEDKLKVPLGTWTHKSHCIWEWYYRAQGNNLQRIERETVYHYNLVMGHRRTRTMWLYQLAWEEVLSPATQIELPNSISGLSNQRVVKLNKGPAFPQAPKKLKNFWEYLHSWEENWMWEGINNDQETKSDTTWLADGMTNSLLIWVTDGSYNQKKVWDLSGVGWIIFCTRTGKRLVGTFWEKSARANLYRTEMVGLCTLHLLAQVVAEF